MQVEPPSPGRNAGGTSPSANNEHRDVMGIRCAAWYFSTEGSDLEKFVFISSKEGVERREADKQVYAVVIVVIFAITVVIVITIIAIAMVIVAVSC